MYEVTYRAGDTKEMSRWKWRGFDEILDAEEFIKRIKQKNRYYEILLDRSVQIKMEQGYIGRSVKIRNEKRTI